MAFQIDQTSKRILDQTRKDAHEAARVRGVYSAQGYPSPLQQTVNRFIGLATITGAGADSTHWKWMFALRDPGTGLLVAGNFGSDQAGECVVLDNGASNVGAEGALYLLQHNDGSPVILVFVPLAGQSGIVGWFIPSAPVLVSGNQARWAYTGTESTSQWTTTGKSQIKAGGRIITMYNSWESGNPANGIGTMGGGKTITSTGFANGYKLLPITSCVAVPVYVDNTCNTSSSSSSSSAPGDLPPPIYLFVGANDKADCDTPGVGGF